MRRVRLVVVAWVVTLALAVLNANVWKGSTHRLMGVAASVAVALPAISGTCGAST